MEGYAGSQKPEEVVFGDCIWIFMGMSFGGEDDYMIWADILFSGVVKEEYRARIAMLRFAVLSSISYQ